MQETIKMLRGLVDDNVTQSFNETSLSNTTTSGVHDGLSYSGWDSIGWAWIFGYIFTGVIGVALETYLCTMTDVTDKDTPRLNKINMPGFRAVFAGWAVGNASMALALKAIDDSFVANYNQADLVTLRSFEVLFGMPLLGAGAAVGSCLGAGMYFRCNSRKTNVHYNDYGVSKGYFPSSQMSSISQPVSAITDQKNNKEKEGLQISQIQVVVASPNKQQLSGYELMLERTSQRKNKSKVLEELLENVNNKQNQLSLR